MSTTENPTTEAAGQPTKSEIDVARDIIALTMAATMVVRESAQDPFTITRLENEIMGCGLDEFRNRFMNYAGPDEVPESVSRVGTDLMVAVVAEAVRSNMTLPPSKLLEILNDRLKQI